MNRILSIEKLDRYGRVTESSPGLKEPLSYEGSGRKTGRVRVTLENGESFTVSERRALRLGLKAGAGLTEELHEEIFTDLRSSCMQRCGSLLGRRDYPERRLRTKLEDAGYPPVIIEECIAKLTAAHYLDDRRYVQNYVRSHLNDRSRRRIIRDLLGRGIAEDMIEEAFAAAGEETDPDEAQRRQIRCLLKKRGFDPDSADYKEKQKTMAFLHRKGFEADLIRRSVEEPCE